MNITKNWIAFNEKCTQTIRNVLKRLYQVEERLD